VVFDFDNTDGLDAVDKAELIRIVDKKKAYHAEQKRIADSLALEAQQEIGMRNIDIHPDIKHIRPRVLTFSENRICYRCPLLVHWKEEWENLDA